MDAKDMTTAEVRAARDAAREAYDKAIASEAATAQACRVTLRYLVLMVRMAGLAEALKAEISIAEWDVERADEAQARRHDAWREWDTLQSEFIRRLECN